MLRIENEERLYGNPAERGRISKFRKIYNPIPAGVPRRAIRGAACVAVLEVQDPASPVLAAPHGVTAMAAEDPVEEAFETKQKCGRRVLPAHDHRPPLVGETLVLEN